MWTLDLAVRVHGCEDKRKHGKLFAAYLNIEYMFRFMYNIHCMSSLNQLSKMLKQ